MGGIFLVWLIPVLLLIGLALVTFYLCLRPGWPAKDEGKSDLELALEQERQESRVNQEAGSLTDQQI